MENGEEAEYRYIDIAAASLSVTTFLLNAIEAAITQSRPSWKARHVRITAEMMVTAKLVLSESASLDLSKLGESSKSQNQMWQRRPIDASVRAVDTMSRIGLTRPYRAKKPLFCLASCSDIELLPAMEVNTDS